jgi:hypothetical protein
MSIQESTINNYKNICNDNDLTLIECYKKLKHNYIICSCNKCNYIHDLNYCSLKKYKECKECLILERITKRMTNGFSYIRHYTEQQTKVIVSCDKCGTEHDRALSNMKLKKITCDICVINKYKELLSNKGFGYINHYIENNHTYIKAKHLACNKNIRISLSNFIRNSYQCTHCYRREFSRGFIYKLKLDFPNNNFFYIGLTERTLKARYNGHMKSCFNTRKSEYHSKKYVIIRLSCEFIYRSIYC